MDRALNPFNPGAGLTPPALVGRASELETFDTIVARTRAGLISRSIVLTGLRGVGKTVLLNAMADRAVNMNWFVGRLEARNDEKGATSVRARLARELVIAARRLGPPKRLSGK
uniref:ATP-binding protein n=1 Tax=Pseudactinotalea sp. TaxID=1926260 RepID=UPI003B3BB836